MSGDLQKAVSVLGAGAETLEDLGEAEHAAGLFNRAIELLEHAGSGDQRDIVAAAAVSFCRDTLSAKFRAASGELAALTGLPDASLRTRAGWDAALSGDGHGPRAFARLARLPGTTVVLGVSQLVAISAVLDDIDSGRLHHRLQEIWDTCQPDPVSFDAVIGRLHPYHPEVGRLGWAIIRVETLKHVNLIWHQANKLERSFPDRTASDLLGWGWVGLRTALRLYNPRLGFTFSTYAVTRIIGSIRDGVRMENPIPKRLGTFQRKVSAVEAELTQVLGRAPTLEEVSQRVGAEISQLEVLRRTQTPAPFDETTFGEGDQADADDSVEDRAALALLRDELDDALSRIDPDEAQAVRLLILEGLTATEARTVTGATARQIRQRKERGLAALRDHLGHWDPATGA